jgi:hypothetical protein
MWGSASYYFSKPKEIRQRKKFGKRWLRGSVPACHRSAGFELRPVRVGVAVVKVLLELVFLEGFGLLLSVPFPHYSALHSIL